MRTPIRRLLLGICLLAGPGYALHAQDISTNDLLTGLSNPARWLTHSGDYAGQRFSPLTQITPSNVDQLAAQWTFQTGVVNKFEATPIVVDGIVYVTGALNHAWAIDGRTGRQIWHYQRALPQGLKVCCGMVNRGFAIHRDRLFMATLDAHFVALDAKSGKVIYDIEMAAAQEGFAGTGAPLVVNDKVVVGIAGGEFANRGFLDAYDPAANDSAGGGMRLHASIGALILAWMAIGLASAPRALGRPGVTPVPCPQQEWLSEGPQFEPLPGAKAFSGKYDGGVYRVEIPEKWNGDLVLYAHGFVTNSGPQGSRLRVGNAVIRQHLVDRGYAWATSSYRCNGYVPGQGLIDTKALTDRFVAHNEGRQPRRIYLTGSSMGGHVTVLGMHEFPTAFAGGLAMCPAGPELFDFFAASSAAAEVVTGIRFTPDTVRQDIAAMTEQLGKPPDLTPKGRQLASIEIHISGGPRPFAVEGLASRLLANMSTSQSALIGSTTPLNRAVDTAHVRYAIDDGLGLTAEQIDARARRKAGDPEVRSASGPYEEVVPYDGRIERPLLTMHGTGDLFVPIFLQRTLKQSVRGAGRLDLLAQRIYRISGHCGFSQPEMIRAFDDLVAWVEQGRKPAGDDVDGDLSNAGLQFTDPLRPNDPGTRRILSSSQH